MNAAIDICDCCCMKNAEEHRESFFCSEFVVGVAAGLPAGGVGLIPVYHHCSGITADTCASTWCSRRGYMDDTFYLWERCAFVSLTGHTTTLPPSCVH